MAVTIGSAQLTSRFESDQIALTHRRAWIARGPSRLGLAVVLIDSTQAARLPAPAVLDGYAPIPGTYDEQFEANGDTRPHAHMVAALLANMSPNTFARC